MRHGHAHRSHADQSAMSLDDIFEGGDSEQPISVLEKWKCISINMGHNLWL